MGDMAEAQRAIGLLGSHGPWACEGDFPLADRILGPLGHSSSAYTIKAVNVASRPVVFRLPSSLDARHATHRCTVARSST
eukprot:12826910-Heterocapsa_arctica.AAC.1